MTKAIEECVSCKFYRVRKDLDMEGWAGFCVRFPPIFKEDRALNDGWPNVYGQSWCGEFSEKKEDLTND